MKICSPLSFDVDDWTRATAKCTKMKNVSRSIAKLNWSQCFRDQSTKLNISPRVLRSSTQLQNR